MLDLITRQFCGHFASLPHDAQQSVFDATNAGQPLTTTVSLSDGAYRCALGALTLWEEPLTEADARIIGEAAAEILDDLPLEASRELSTALKNGGRLLVAVDHVSGKAGVHLAHAGQIMCLAKLQTPTPVWQ